MDPHFLYNTLDRSVGQPDWRRRLKPANSLRPCHDFSEWA
ncbi:histidine kinase [Paenibacillus periandrae]|nr:histidine kinase [Paenibacillus periandrae]